MKIYKLSPVDKQSHHWKASTFKGDVFVRAKSEDRARRIASMKYCIAVEHTGSSDTLAVNPWVQGNIVSAEIDDSGRFKDVGDEAILVGVSTLKAG